MYYIQKFVEYLQINILNGSNIHEIKMLMTPEKLKILKRIVEECEDESWDYKRNNWKII